MTGEAVETVVLILFGTMMTLIAAVQTERLQTVRDAMVDREADLKGQLGDLAARAVEAEEHAPARGARGRFVKREV